MHNKFNFPFFFIGLNTTLFLFRDLFLPLKIIYVLCNVYIAIRALYLLVLRKEYFSKNIILGKYFIYILSLLLAFSFSVDFLFKNLFSSISIFLLAIAFLKKSNSDEFESFFLGYKISLIINFIYTGFELILLLYFKVRINVMLYTVLGINDIHDLSRTNRVSGLIWDPYLLGIFCATSFFLFRNKIFKFYILIILYYSGSRSGQIGLFMAVIYYYYPYFLSHRKVVMLFIISLFVLSFAPVFIKNTRFGGIGSSRSEGETRRVEYFTFIPKIWEHDNNLLKVLFGGAPMYTGARFYYTDVESVTKRTIPEDNWAIESDWSGILLGRGLTGFIYYIYIFFMIMLNQKNRSLKAMAISILFAGIGYSYDLAIFINYILFFACSFHMKLDEEDKTSIKNTDNMYKIA